MLKPMVPAISTTLPKEYRYVKGAAKSWELNNLSRTPGHISMINEFMLNASNAG